MAEYIVRIISTPSKKRNTGEKFKYHKLALRHNATKQQFRLSDISKMSDDSRIETYDIAPRGTAKATQNKLARQRLDDLKRDVERMRDNKGKTWDMWIKDVPTEPLVKVTKNFYESIPFLMNDSAERRASGFQSFIVNHFLKQKSLTHEQVHSPVNYKAWLGKLKELKGKLASDTLQTHWQNLIYCGKQAQDLKLVTSIPQNIKPPKGFFKKTKSDIYVATEEELKTLDEIDIMNHKNLRFTDMATRLRYEDIRNAFMFSAIYTGIRPQSLEIMKWSQITEEDGKMKVEVIPNKENVDDYWLYTSLHAYEYLGTHGNDDDYVFPYYPRVGVGGFKNQNSKSAILSKSFKAICHHAGIDNELLTIRQCRHTHALKTLQSTNNNMWAVKERLGHMDMSTTQKHYAKFLKDFQEDTLKHIDSFSKYQTRKI